LSSGVVARGLTKHYGKVVALRGANISLGRGDTMVVRGRNGSGKSTLLRLIAGLARPTSGTVEIEGKLPSQMKGSIGYLGHDPYLYPNLSAVENLRFFAKMFGANPSAANKALDAVGLNKRDKPLRELSKGEAQRAAIARCLLHGPQYLILDEPLTGLDRSGSETVTALIREFPGTVIVATHLGEGFEESQTLELSEETKE